jgi:Protein of unknown function (DUF4232)
MSAHVPALPLESDPLIAEAKQRARRRRLFAASAVLAIGVAVIGLRAFGAGGGSGEVPWLPTKPQLGAANPSLAPACRAAQLRGKLAIQGIGFGMLGGPLMITNRGSAPCALVGMPRLSFAGATSTWRQRRGPQENVYDPLTRAQSSLRALAPGRSAAAYLRWSNWCGRGSNPVRSDPGQPPRAMVLSAPGGGRVSIGSNLLHRQSTTPICDAPTGSILAASRFTPIVPQGPPSSALPLRAQIVVNRPVAPGGWLSYTVVLTNRSAKPFSFGRACPAYEEGFGFRPQAYVLNCRAVGSIAPHRAVRFAMRLRLPSRVWGKVLTWTLAPHSWNAPSATRVLRRG